MNQKKLLAEHYFLNRDVLNEKVLQKVQAKHSFSYEIIVDVLDGFVTYSSKLIGNDGMGEEITMDVMVQTDTIDEVTQSVISDSMLILLNEIKEGSGIEFEVSESNLKLNRGGITFSATLQ